MSFSLAFIKDALKQIIKELEKQDLKIDQVISEHEMLKELFTVSPEDKQQEMAERMANARAAKAAKK